MPKLAAGTLVQVKKSALDGGANVNIDVVDDHGWLWFVDSKRPSLSERPSYNCTSLATGERFFWYVDEITVAAQEQEEPSC